MLDIDTLLNFFEVFFDCNKSALIYFLWLCKFCFFLVEHEKSLNQFASCKSSVLTVFLCRASSPDFTVLWLTVTGSV